MGTSLGTFSLDLGEKERYQALLRVAGGARCFAEGLGPPASQSSNVALQSMPWVSWCGRPGLAERMTGRLYDIDARWAACGWLGLAGGDNLAIYLLDLPGA